jgi:RNA polymerase sigma factor (sigma-70 family)
MAKELTDAELLGLFVRNKQEQAFEELIRRYGPMVLATCRRTIQDEHLVQEAVQATFLVLAKKASSLRPPFALASWLHQVAYRVTSQLRGDMLSARQREVPIEEALEIPMKEEQIEWNELRPILDEELNRMTEKHRAPLVLCYLDGKTNEEAAQLLNWPIGSISYRLERARELLRARLTKRGLALSTATLFTLLQEKATAAATFPPELLISTKKAAVLIATHKAATGVISAQAAGLVTKIMKAMFMEKLKLAAAIILTTTTIGTSTLVIAQNFKNETTALNLPSPTPSVKPVAALHGANGINLNPSSTTQPPKIDGAAQTAPSPSAGAPLNGEQPPQIPQVLLAQNGRLLPGAAPSTSEALNNDMRLIKKANTIIIDDLKFNQTPLATVITQLADRSRDVDPDHEGITFSLDESLASYPLTLKLHKISVINAVVTISVVSKISYKVENGCIILQPKVVPNRNLNQAE